MTGLLSNILLFLCWNLSRQSFHPAASYIRFYASFSPLMLSFCCASLSTHTHTPKSIQTIAHQIKTVMYICTSEDIQYGSKTICWVKNAAHSLLRLTTPAPHRPSLISKARSDKLLGILRCCSLPSLLVAPVTLCVMRAQWDYYEAARMPGQHSGVWGVGGGTDENLRSLFLPKHCSTKKKLMKPESRAAKVYIT